MKLTGTLKEKFDDAKSNEAKIEVLAQAGIQLTDDELRDVEGGLGSIELLDDDCNMISRRVLTTDKVVVD